MNTATQRDMVRSHITRHGRINKRESEQLYGCERLAARIGELRQEGYAIKTDRCKVLNRWDKPCYVADYVMLVHGQQEMAL